MRKQTLLVVVLALAFGGVAAGGVFLFAGRDASAGPPMATILVMAAEVPRGDTIMPEMVVEKKYPRDLVPAGVLKKAEEAVGRSALTPLVKDEPLLDGKLAPKGAGRGLASLIKPGMRAIAVQTPNVATGVAGFIVPGNLVDVLLTFNDTGRDEKNGGGAITLLEKVEILAVDQKVDAPAENRVDASAMRSVTLSVTPEQATKLTLAQNRGTIHLSLRNSNDAARPPSRPATVADLRGGNVKTWDERLRDVLAEVNRAAAAQRPAVTAAIAKATGPVAATPQGIIRTFRGKHEGMVRLDLGGPRRGK